MKPKNASKSPIVVKEKNVKGSSPVCEMAPEITKLVEEPTKVVIPPNIVT